MSQAHPDWWQIINLILIDHEERIAALEKELIQDSGFPDSGHYDFPSVAVPYPERNDKRVLALEIEVGRLREEVEYLRSLATVANKPTGIKTWQALILVFYATIAVLIAGLSLWLVSASH